MSKDKRRRGTAAAASEAEDRAVWDHVARQVKASPLMKKRVPDSLPSPEEQMLLGSEARVVPKPGATTRPAPAIAQPVRRPAPPLADFDAKKARRIASGRIEIDARLDLHGLTQDEAHDSLTAFLISAHARGLRIVHVITGKGGPPIRNGSHGDPWGRERGVLKRNVPRWLEEPELRRIVVSHTSASQKHGGEGALYIHLRAPGR